MERILDPKKLPPLKALKGFESTARLLSFRQAAQELNITHPAISHQIQSLEESLGVKLFIRGGRKLSLTPEGYNYYPLVREVLEMLINGSEAVRRSAQPDQLRIQTYITTSIRWLSARLSRFRTAHPQIPLQITSSIYETQFDEANADVGFVFSNSALPEHIHWTGLFQPTLFPVCAPALTSARDDLTPTELLNYPLITVTSEIWQWKDWFATTELGPIEPVRTISTDSTALALEMAMDGEGITLINGPFADKDLAAKRLIQPSPHKVENFGEWGLACREDMRNQLFVRIFIDWLIEDSLMLELPKKRTKFNYDRSIHEIN